MEYLYNMDRSEQRRMDLHGTAYIKRLNTVKIMKALLRNGDMSRAQLSRTTKLSAPTVTRISADLISAGLVKENGLVQTGEVGAPASALSFNAEAGYIVGINIGESVIQFAVSNLLGEVLNTYQNMTRARLGGDDTTNQIVQGISELLKCQGIALSDVWSVCIGVPGTVADNGEGGICVNAPDIAGWSGYPLKEKLAEVLQVKDIFIENAQNLAVICEYNIGCAKGVENIVFIHVKAGVGAGVMIQGKLYRGSGGKAGEVGFCLPGVHWPARPREGTDARHGVLEWEIGFDGILKDVHSSVEGISEGNMPDLEKIYRKAAQGDTKIYEKLRETWDYLGMLAVNLSVILNPKMIILGGDIMPLGEDVLAVVEKYVNDYSLEPPEIRLSQYKNETCMLGAVQMGCGRAYKMLGLKETAC